MIPAIITISCILGLWLIIIISTFIVLSSLRKKLQRREHSINVILAQKYDLLVSLGKLMQGNGITLPENIKEALNISDYSSLKTINTQERLSVKTLLMKTVNTMFYIAEENGLSSSSRYITIKNSISDIDDHHRKEIALYNSDITAYNYWVRAYLFRPVAYLFRIKKKEWIFTRTIRRKN